jgi:hypothetical protein
VQLFSREAAGDFCTSGSEREFTLERSWYADEETQPEQIVTLLRQIEVEIANGKSTPQACKEAEITQQTYHRWRKEYCGLKLDQAKRLKELTEPAFCTRFTERVYFTTFGCEFGFSTHGLQAAGAGGLYLKEKHPEYPGKS